MNAVTSIIEDSKDENAVGGAIFSPTFSARFLATMQAVYEVDGVIHTNNINLMTDNKTGFISKDDMARLHVGAVRQVCQETGITPDGMRDIIIMNICNLGWSTHEQFYGEKAPETAEVV